MDDGNWQMDHELRLTQPHRLILMSHGLMAHLTQVPGGWLMARAVAAMGPRPPDTQM